MTQRPTASGRTREELETDAAHLLRFTPDELMVRPATPLIDQIAADRAAFSEDLAVFQAMTAEQREHMTELRSILVSGEASLHRIEQERQELQLELDEILAQLAQRDHPLAAEPIVLTHVRDLMGLVQRQIERKADSLPEFLHLSRNVKQVLDAVLTPTELTPTPLTPVPGAPVPGGPAPGEPVRRPGVTR